MEQLSEVFKNRISKNTDLEELKKELEIVERIFIEQKNIVVKWH